MRIDSATAFLSGCAAVAAVNSVLGWWLDSGGAVAAVLLCLAAIAWTAGRGRPEALRARVIGLWSGAMVASTAIMVLKGPGTLGPLAIVIAGVLVAAGVLAGFAIAWLVRADQDKASPSARTPPRP